MSDLRAHVKPEPIEAAETQPVAVGARLERHRNQVRMEALYRGWDAMTAEGPALSSFSSFKAGVEAYELYLAKHDRRGRS